MEHHTTIPSLLDSISEPAPGAKPAGNGLILKLLFWGVIGLMLVSALRFFTR